MSIPKVKPITPIEQKGYFLAELFAIPNPIKKNKIIVDTEILNQPDFVVRNNVVKVIEMPTKELQEKYAGKLVYVLDGGLEIESSKTMNIDKNQYTKDSKLYKLINLASIIAENQEE